jgi:phosphohistidine phosphatase
VAFGSCDGDAVKLYVMRHGSAEDRADSGMDSDRALTSSGRERVRSVAKLLLELDEAPLHIVTSPLVRAVQTAEVVAVVTKLSDRDGTVEVRRELAAGNGGGAALVASLASTSGRRVMLVGHEPDLSELASNLLAKSAARGASKQAPSSFDKAMVLGIYVGPSGEHSRLRFVLDPRALRLDPDLRGAGP